MKKLIGKIIIAVIILAAVVGIIMMNKQSGTNEDNTLVVGLDDSFPPMGFRDEKNELVGFDIDLATIMAEKMDIEIQFQPIDWAMKESELNGKNIDMIWNGYTITEKRKEQVAFTNPYLENRQIIVVLADSNIQTKEDLKGATLAVQKESSALEAVLADETVAASLKDGKPIEFDTNIDCFMDLEAKRSEAIVCDEVLARYVIKQRGEEKYRILEDNFGTEEYGIGVRKEDTELLKQLNDALAECMQDGSYDEVYQTWFTK